MTKKLEYGKETFDGLNLMGDIKYYIKIRENLCVKYNFE